MPSQPKPDPGIPREVTTVILTEREVEVFQTLVHAYFEDADVPESVSLEILALRERISDLGRK